MKPLRYLSVCSGIEAASVAWKPLGWQCAAVAEIDPFACRVLAERHGAARPLFMPEPGAISLPSVADLVDAPLDAAQAALASVMNTAQRRNAIKAVADLSPDAPLPNFGDLEQFQRWPDATVDLLVGGTPCQAFSIAGFREGLADPRGNLALVYLAILERYNPEWFLWENVPGVLSSNGGRDFGSFIGGLAELGYGFAYRILDAQFVRTCRLPGAVPQRRRRVFVVGRRGDWRGPAAVLFDAACLRGDSPPIRRARKNPAAAVADRARVGGGQIEPIGPDVSGTLAARDWRAARPEDDVGLIGERRSNIDLDVAHTLRAEGFDATEDGSGRGTPLIPVVSGTLLARPNRANLADLETYVPVPFDLAQITAPDNRSRAEEGAPAGTLAAGSQPHIAYRIGGDGDGWEEGDRTAPLTTGTDRTAHVLVQAASEVAPTVRAGGNSTGGDRPYGTDVDTADSLIAAFDSRNQPWAVRRLMPVECERLQGFTDGYTDVPTRKGKRAPDGPRYKAVGNSMAVNVMEWLGERIELVRGILEEIEQ